MSVREEHPEWFPKCDYLECVNRYRQDDFIQCREGRCAHYGNCLPVDGFRETPERAIGEWTREKGEYYHNLIVMGEEV